MNETIQHVRKKDLIDVYKALSNPISYKLFEHIASNGIWTEEDKIRPFAKTAKIWYQDMGKLIKAGLVARVNSRKYAPTSYGRIFNQIQKDMLALTEAYYKLGILDKIKKDFTGPQEEYVKIEEAILGEHKSLLKYIERTIIT